MKKAYVIGTSVKDSLSPTIFNHWFKKHNIKAIYKHQSINKKNFNKKIKKLLVEKNLSGVNITIPFKEKIVNKVHALDKHAKKIGAVNCVFVKNNRYYGINTDWIGFRYALSKAGVSKNKITKGKTIVLGYGGAAKAILYCLSLMGGAYKKNTLVFNRTKKKLTPHTLKQKTTLDINSLAERLDEASFVINTIPGNILRKLKIKKIKKRIVVCDIVYKPKETEFIKHFTNPSAKVYGIEMLIGQARPCFYRWHGIMPSADASLTKKLQKKTTR